MKKIILILCLFLTACGTVTVQANGNKRAIEFTNPPAFSLTPEAEFAGHDVQFSMETQSMVECPGGYTIQSKRYVAEKHALVWNITCLKP